MRGGCSNGLNKTWEGRRAEVSYDMKVVMECSAVVEEGGGGLQ